MLLVDDRKTQTFERDVFLHESVRADRDVDRPVSESREDLASPVAGDTRREKRVRRASVHEQRGQRSCVLLGEELRRRHERGLRARRCRDTRSERGDDRLSRADVPFEQPRHRYAPTQVRANLLERALLRAGECERQLGDPPRKLFVRNAQGKCRGLRGPPRTPLREGELQHEKLVERESPSRREQALDVIGEVHLPERRGDVRKTVALADRRWERLRDLADKAGPPGAAFDRGMQPTAHLPRLDALGERIDRNEASRVDGLRVRALERWLTELERPPEEPALA